MYIKEYVSDFYELRGKLWSGALWTMDQIAANDKEVELMELLEEIWDEDYNPPDIVTINDYLWFDYETIFKELGIPNPYKEEDEENELL